MDQNTTRRGARSKIRREHRERQAALPDAVGSVATGAPAQGVWMRATVGSLLARESTRSGRPRPAARCSVFGAAVYGIPMWRGAVPKLTAKRWHQMVTARYFPRSVPAGMS